MSSDRLIRAYLEANRRMMAESKDMTLATTVTFLGAAVWSDHEDLEGEPLTLEDLAVKVGMTPTTISQHLRYLGGGYRLGRPGLGLVLTDANPDNRRKKTFGLTPKGRGLAAQLALILRRAT
ncbi:ArsR family transcriptional regulator [Nitratireductor pacificus]|uniref:Uncharacterized protein n=1 Tax=Nitratireductor pacificus pht-3B TaxID=391937 RepID=K2LGJ0_9HYPH|nr:ArsR family transcriptional regulator [Nitratireductor pacificus]EKF16894.1 hypothetical protein NA2_20699 [Nitratireductor pacificus pht-3B]